MKGQSPELQSRRDVTKTAAVVGSLAFAEGDPNLKQSQGFCFSLACPSASVRTKTKAGSKQASNEKYT